jgi:hypothetical protein
MSRILLVGLESKKDPFPNLFLLVLSLFSEDRTKLPSFVVFISQERRNLLNSGVSLKIVVKL